MKPHGAAEILQGKIATGAAAATGWLSVIGTLLEVIPVLLGIVVAFLSAVLLSKQIKKRSLEGKLLSFKVKEKEREEAENEVKRREAEGLPCRRCTDKEHIKGAKHA